MSHNYTKYRRLHIEISLKSQDPLSKDEETVIINSSKRVLFGGEAFICPSLIPQHDIESDGNLANKVDRIFISELDDARGTTLVYISDVELVFHLFHMHDTEPEEEQGICTDDNAQTDPSIMYLSWELPNRGLDGIWESLYYDSDVTKTLINHIQVMMIFSNMHVDANIVSLNRLIFLHGPPGTGKSSLCRSLAHKVACRYRSTMSRKHVTTKLIEINSHSLFSKYYSESGKLVQNIFQDIFEQAQEDDIFLFVLIDEIESLVSCRSVSSSSEPLDSLRVVNTILTQIDKLRASPNVLIMATSNLIERMDEAFLDRADLIQFVQLPSQECIYSILCSCIDELFKKGLVFVEDEAQFQLMSPEWISSFEFGDNAGESSDPKLLFSRRLWGISGMLKVRTIC